MSAIANLSTHSIHELSRDTALLAGDLSIEYGLAMADSIILAHAKSTDAKLVTLNNDFLIVPNVKVLQN